MFEKNRRSIRLPKYDYARPGLYFITIVTQNRKHRFGEIENGRMNINENGWIVWGCWYDLNKFYNNIRLRDFVIMPNHIHGIIELIDVAVGAGLRPAQDNNKDRAGRVDNRAGHRPAPTRKHGLPEIVRAFKSFSSNKINLLNDSRGTKTWQRNYYEHIIRDEDDYQMLAQYIQHNPGNWDHDEFLK